MQTHEVSSRFRRINRRTMRRSAAHSPDGGELPDFPARPKGLCYYCGDPATKVVEMRISDMPVPGSRATRGTHNTSVMRRCCLKHAKVLDDLLHRKPAAATEAERRAGGDRRA